MHDTDDLYEILQVHYTAEPEVIQAAYKRLARKYHPDVNHSPDAEEITKGLTSAYEVLGDPVKRAAYDRQRHGNKRNGQEAAGREAGERRARQQQAERERQEQDRRERAEQEERQRRARQERAEEKARTRRQAVVMRNRWRWASAVGSVLALMLLFVFVLRSSVHDRLDTRSPVAVVPSRSEDVFLPLRSGMRFRDCAGCPEMVVVPAGELTMGASDDVTNARPLRDVRVRQFALGQYEVTRREYAAFVSATSYVVGDGCYVTDDKGDAVWDRAASWRAPGFDQDADHPVVCASWRDARAYLQWLSENTRQEYRLPTEAEWEYAARAGTRTRWYWGRDSSLQCDFANGSDRTLEFRLGNWRWSVAPCQDDAAYTTAIGSYAANVFGVSDILGNVWEWTEDCWHQSYRGAPSDGSAWTLGGDCSERVLRGGSWQDSPRRLRSDLRNRYAAGRRSLSSVGFRVARTME